MHPATVHGVGVIAKLRFAIFAPFKESMTLNFAQRSSKVIDFGTNRKRVYIFILDTGAAATKPPPPVIFLQVAVSHIYTTKSQPSVTFESDSVSHIFNDWRRLSFYNVIMY